MVGTITRIDHLTNNITTIWFAPDQPIHYEAGQFTSISLASDSDTATLQHEFTLSSSPTEDSLAFTTRIPSAPSQFKQRLARLKIGDTLHFNPPIGAFVLPRDKTIPLLFVAAGIGITPYRSIITSLQDTHEDRTIKLVYIHAPDDTPLFTSLFEHYGLETHYISSEGKRTTLTEEIATMIYSNKTAVGSYVYIAGPENFIINLLESCKQQPSRTDITFITDYFPGYQTL